jgi:hypothetical protein
MVFNPENALENLFRVEPASNQRLRRLLFEIRSSAPDTEEKALIYCIIGSHNEVLMHYLGSNVFFCLLTNDGYTGLSGSSNPERN